MKMVQYIRINVSKLLYGSMGPKGPHVLQNAAFIDQAGSIQEHQVVFGCGGLSASCHSNSIDAVLMLNRHN